MKALTVVIVSGAVLLAAAGLAVVGAGWWLLQPAQPGSNETVTIEITRGSGESLVARQVAEAGLTKHRYSLRLALALEGQSGELQSGVYQVNRGWNARQLATSLTRNTTDLRVTLPEGLRAEEVLESLETQLRAETATPEACLDANGYLFPDTYSFIPGTSIESACERLQNQFKSVWTELTTQHTPPSQWSQEDLVTLAALVQREARDPDDMRRVAGVLFNRLDLGMPLQIDATLQYAKGYNPQTKDWWSMPYAADKSIVSPYNTYQDAGLPAGPIANPGRDALTAVLNPIDSDDLYYISTLDGGEMYFVPTYEEHLQNIDRYLR